MTKTANLDNLFADAEVRYKESIKPELFAVISENLDLLESKGHAEDKYKENIKTVSVTLDLIDKTIFVQKIANSQGSQGKPSFFKIALCEFEPILA